MAERGFIAVARSNLSHPVVGAEKPFSAYEAWHWMLCEAAYKPRRIRAGGSVLELRRGQFAHSERFLADKWGWSKSKVHRFLLRLETEAMANRNADHETNLITICKYDEYQIGRTSDEPAGEPQTGPAPDQQRTKEKESNKVKNDDGSGTVACLISPEAKELTREITVLCGHDLKFIPPAWCGAENRVHQWLAQGWPINVILASVKEQIAKKTGGPPDSVNYFEKGISRAYARYTAPIPVSDLPRGAYEITTKPGAGAVAKHIVSEFNRELEARGVDSGAYQPTHRRVQTG